MLCYVILSLTISIGRQETDADCNNIIDIYLCLRFYNSEKKHILLTCFFW